MKTIYLLHDMKANDIAIVLTADNDEVAKRAIASAVASMKKSNNIIDLNIWKDCILNKVNVKDFERVEGLDLSSICDNEVK